MHWLSLFFDWGVDPGMLLYGEYEPWLVLLSVCVAMFSSTVGLYAAGQARASTTASMRQVMRLAGSVSLAGGVWAMHFVGMLAFRLCTPVGFDVGLTLLSGLPALGAAWVALSLLSQPTFHRPHIVAGGALMGAGIGAMHYLGMAAMQLSAALRYDPVTFGLSVVVAIVLSILALGLRFGLASRLGQRPILLNLLSGAFMGGAIAGMHYTGMAAAHFVGRAQPGFAVGLLNPAPLALGVTLVTVVATALVAAASALARYRQLVQAMQIQATQLRAVVDTSIDGIMVMDEQGRVLAFNAGAVRITGYTPEQMVGGSASQIMIEPHRSLARQDFLAYMTAFPLGMEHETAVRRADGSESPIRLVVGRAPVETGVLYVASFTDTSERTAMEKALRHSEQQFRSLIGNIPGISYRARLGQGWPLVYISEAVAGITGHVAAEFLGEAPQVRIADLVSQEDALRIRDQVTQSVTQDKPFVIEFKLQHRDGEPRWIWGTGRGVRDDDGKMAWVDGVLLDISERRGMEEDLRQAKQQAEAAMHARTAFLANMSHEIRTPMNAIIGFTEVVLATSLADEPRQHLQTVRSAARSLLVLLNDILDTSKLDRGAVELEHLPYDLRAVLRQVADEQMLMARRKGLALHVQCAPELPVALMGDAHRMRQVLVNLVGNAVKFTDRGEVTLGARLDGPDRLHLWVQDTGIGIAADRLERIFDPFTQADASMSRRYGGTGLGTTISRQLVDLMGGRIWVESTLGQGSTFRVSLPCVAASAALPAVRPPQLPLATSPALPPLRVLVVDDVNANRQLLAVTLGREGHQIIQAEDGLEAVAQFQSGGLDLILMDLQMPRLDGLSACRRIRAIEARQGLPRLPIVALSASVFAHDRAEAEKAGMDGFAIKPVEHAVLRAEIHRARAACLGTPLPTSSGLADQALPITAPQGPGQPPAPANARLLDAADGRRRWGDDAAWAQALVQFCRHKRDWLRHDQPHDAEALLALGHRFKGVAANLAMPSLAQAADELERCARAGQPADLAWRALRETVTATLAAVQAELDTLDALNTDQPGGVAGARDTTAAPVAPAPAPTGALSDAQWGPGLQALAQALRQGEHPEAAWRHLAPHGPARFGADAWARLSQAVDDFDFDAAAQAVDNLLDTVQPAPAGQPPIAAGAWS